MKEKLERILIIIGVFWFWMFVFQGIDLADGKDPDYPTKPITFYIGFSAGGTTDVSARAIIEATSKYLGQPFIPVNKAGAGGALAAMAVMNAKPDGYTLGVNVGSSVLIMPHTEECPYRDLGGFTLIMNYLKHVYPLTVGADAPWKNWKEFIEWARQNPGAAKIGTVGARSISPMGIALWQVEQKERTKFTYIVYKGGSEALSALLGGHIPLEITSLDLPKVQYLKEGKIRILAYLGSEKMPGYENIPSFKDLYGFEAVSVMGVWGPKGIPEYVLEKLDDAFGKGVKEPTFIDVMNRMYTPVVYMNRGEVNRYVREAFPRVGEIVKTLRAEEAKEKK